MTHRYSVSHVYLVLGILVALVCVTAPIATAMDAPALIPGISGHAKQTITITAGTSGLPNGFTVWWMDDATFSSYNREWPASPVAGMGYASFTGAPSVNTFGGQYTTFLLGPNESMMIEIGDLLSETGVDGMTEELAYGTEYHFVAFANDGSGQPASALSVTIEAQTTTSTNCTYTIGYWKNHEEQWPATDLDLGGVNYTKQQLLDILNTPVQGNGLVSLAHQLIAAKLNIIAGAEPTAAAQAILDADALIGSLVVPPIGSGYIHPSQTSNLTQILDDYNNGVIGPGHCGIVPAEETSWGSLKARFK